MATRIKLKYDHSVPRHGKSKSKPTTTTTRAPRLARSPSLSDLSADDGYSGVEDISDAEDEEKDVVAAEERHILKRELHPQPHTDDEDADDEKVDDDDDDEDDDDDAEQDEDSHDDEAHGNHDAVGEDVDQAEESVWEGISSDEGHQPQIIAAPAPIKPTVRFAGVPSSDSDSTDTDEDPNDHSYFFPDLFINKNDLDPTFRRELDFGVPEPLYTTNNEFGGPIYEDDVFDSEEDFQRVSVADVGESRDSEVDEDEDEDGAAVAAEGTVQQLADEELHGQDDSEGDTTEEDEPEPLPRQSSPERNIQTSESEDTILIKRKRGKARVGSFQLDRTDKPTAVFDAKAGKMIIFTSRAKVATVESSPIHDDPFQFTSPFIPMHTPMYFGILDPSGPLIMPPYPFIGPHFTDTLAGTEWSDGSPEWLEEEYQSEDDLNVDDFLHWGHIKSDGEHGKDDADDADDAYTTRPPTPSTGTKTDYITHLNSIVPDKMGSFRRNQADQQLIYSERATHDSLAFSGPYNATAVRGIKFDRMGTASSPLTPMRRRHTHGDVGRGLSESVAQKRKVGMQHDSAFVHKRQRTLSEITPRGA